MKSSIDTLTALEIKTYQEQKLQEQLSYTVEHSPFYQKLFKEHHLKVSDIRHLEDLQRIPPTTKEDLQDHNNDFLCVPGEKIIDYVTTSGTSGKPVTMALTDNDLERLSYNEALSFTCAGVGPQDILQLTTTIDRRFMAGLAYFLGARKLGAGIIRVGPGLPELQWDSILKFKPTYLIAVPSFLLKLIGFAQQHQIDYQDLGIKGVICIGETIRTPDFSLNTLGQKIANKWKDVHLYTTYASTEMSTAFTECEAKQGGHHLPELIIAEILDKENNTVKPGREGELTITTLGVEGMPLLRFKTGDIVQAHTEPCRCGRTTMRLGPVIGRTNQMIKYKGTTLYPPALVDILNDFEQIKSYVIELSHDSCGLDEICIKMNAEVSADLMQHIKDHFRTKLRVVPKIELTDQQTITALKSQKMSRKPIIVIDHRNRG